MNRNTIDFKNIFANISPPVTFIRDDETSLMTVEHETSKPCDDTEEQLHNNSCRQRRSSYSSYGSTDNVSSTGGIQFRGSNPRLTRQHSYPMDKIQYANLGICDFVFLNSIETYYRTHLCNIRR